MTRRRADDFRFVLGGTATPWWWEYGGGAASARRMLADWKCCLTFSETVDGTSRRDFADLMESVPWLGLTPR